MKSSNFHIWNIKPLKIIAVIYIEIIRGTPMLLQILIMYAGSKMFFGIDLKPFTSAIIAIALNSAAYVSEIVRAGNISLDVTASNISGVASKDPYSRKEAKGDNDQKFYIKLTSLTNGPSLNFTSYSSDHLRVSTALTYPGHPLGTTKSHNYDLVEAKRGHQYYVYASAPMNYANVHGKGNYCP